MGCGVLVWGISEPPHCVGSYPTRHVREQSRLATIPVIALCTANSVAAIRTATARDVVGCGLSGTPHHQGAVCCPHPTPRGTPDPRGRVCVCVWGGGRGAPRHATPQWELAGTQHPGMALRVATARWELTNRELSEPPNPGLSSSHHHHTHGESSPTCPTPGESFPNRQAHIASFQKRHIPVGSSPCRRTPGANSPTRQINHHHIVADVRVVIVCVVAADVVVVVVVVGV